MKRKSQRLPNGWTQKDIKEIIDYYDNQTEEEAVAEMERAEEHAVMVFVPRELMPQVRKLLAQHASCNIQKRRRSRKRR